MNLVLIIGRASAPARLRSLPSGDTLAELQVSVAREVGSADNVPVVVFSPRLAVTRVDAGTEVFVLGRVRRRFYQSGGAVASRTEVVADYVALGSERRRAERLRGRALGIMQSSVVNEN